jgi:hypothetical protein
MDNNCLTETDNKTISVILDKNRKMVRFGPITFHLIIHLLFVLSLSYLTKSDETFSNAELYKNFAKKSGLYVKGDPVIDITTIDRILLT